MFQIAPGVLGQYGPCLHYTHPPPLILCAFPLCSNHPALFSDAQFLQINAPPLQFCLRQFCSTFKLWKSYPFLQELSQVFLPTILPISFSDHLRRQKCLLPLNFCSTYYFSVHLAMKGNLSGDVLLCWNCYSNSALPFASSYACVLTFHLDYKVLFLESCLFFFESPPKYTSLFPLFFPPQKKPEQHLGFCEMSITHLLTKPNKLRLI